MKDSVTRFNFDDAFKALDEIEIPVAEKGIRANRVDLKESMKRVDKFELLFEDFYDVNNTDDMNAVSEEREAEVAKAKLARIEKIVDLDAETEDDILPSYVGKTIIQCPQCMTLFYKDAEDIVRDEENPDVVNVNEVCQHCGNESGYDVVGKVAEETEAAPGDELGTDDFSAEVGDGENDVAIDDGNETTEEAPAEESGEVDDLSAEADLDSLDLDLDAELDLDEEPVEEEEANESLNTSELLKKIEDKNDLKTEHESEKLTLNEDIEDNLDDKLKAHEEYIKELRDTISELEKKLAGTKNEQIKASIQSRIDTTRAELEAALPEAVKVEAETEELPDAADAGIEDATDNTTEEEKAVEEKETTESLHEGKHGRLEATSRDLSLLANGFDEALAATRDLSYDIEIKDDYIISVVSFNIKQVDDIAKKYFAKHDIVPVITEVSEFVHDYKLAPQDKVAEPAQEALGAETREEAKEQGDSLHEAVESMTDTLNRAWEVAKKTNSPIGVTVVTPVGAGTNGKIKEWSKTVNANLYYIDAKNPDLMANGFDEKMISRPDTIIVLDEFDRAPADNQKAISDEIDNLDAQVEMVIAISHDSNLSGDNFKRFKQFVATVEKETTTESLTEDVSMTSSPENFKALLGTKEFKEPISQEEVESFFEDVKIVDNYDWWVDYRPAFEAIAKEVDGKFDFAVNFNVYNEKIIMETSRAIEKDELAKVLDAMTNSKVCKENKWTAVYTGIEDNKNTLIKIQFEVAKQDAVLMMEEAENVEDQKEQPEETPAKEEPANEEPAQAEVKVTAEIDKNITEEDVKKLTEVTEIDEESFNKKITESLCAVYENVESFTMTDCSLADNKLILEGLVAFKSTKTRPTTYVFEAQELDKAINLVGTNSELFESCEINLTTTVIKESLYANELTYKYSVQGNLLEGLIRN